MGFVTVIGTVFEFAEPIDEWPLPFYVAMWDLKHCDPKKCTGKKLMKHNLIKILRLGTLFPGLCLTPLGDKVANKTEKHWQSCVAAVTLKLFYYSM